MCQADARERRSLTASSKIGTATHLARAAPEAMDHAAFLPARAASDSQSAKRGQHRARWRSRRYHHETPRRLAP